jgi:hypothetical protein
MELNKYLFEIITKSINENVIIIIIIIIIFIICKLLIIYNLI